MASGNLHDRIGTMTAIAGTIIAFHQASPIGATLISSGLFAGYLLMSPDVDRMNYNCCKRWGPLKWIWHPYQSCHGHRSEHWWKLFSKWSYRGHFPIYGSAERLIYVLLWAGLFSAIPLATSLVLLPGVAISHLMSIDPGMVGASLLLLWMGLEVQALVHIASDYCPLVRHDFDKI